VVLLQLRNEKSELEGTLAREQEHQMQKLMKHIERLQNEVSSKQETLDQVPATCVHFEIVLTLFLCVLCDTFDSHKCTASVVLVVVQKVV